MASSGGNTDNRGYTSNDYHRVGWQLHTDTDTDTGRQSMSDDHDHDHDHGLAYHQQQQHPRHGSPPPNLPVSPSVDHSEHAHRGADSFSLHSTAPLAPRAVNFGMAAMPVPSTEGLPARSGGGGGGDYFSSGAAQRPPMSTQSTAADSASTSPGGKTHRAGNSSWDLLGNLRKMEHEYEEFDTRNASEGYLRFAQGDVPNNKFTKFYYYILNVSVVTRWILFIVPVLALLWIPGILGFTAFPNTTIWNVKLMWWSIWFSVVWGGWWVNLAVARILPPTLRNTIGLVAVGSRKYIDWIGALHRYVALTSWSGVNWISFNPLINHRSTDGQVASEVSLLTRILFALFICAGILLFEKFSIQWIAGKFHERSYADRIAEQKVAIKILVTLYAHSSDIPGRSDTLKHHDAKDDKSLVDPRKLFKRALKSARVAVTTTTTALGNVASEIAGSSVLQPNSPQAMVQVAIHSANKTRLLARRLFYSFRKPGRDHLVMNDFIPIFPTPEQAEVAFSLLDKDGNGDLSRDEIEVACLEIHREQISIEHSMRDLDSAVGRLDNILMSLYTIVAFLVFAVAVETQFVSLITGASTFVLGLSWLIGGSCQEILTSIIFLFVKHPYDVGDRVDIEKASYTVKEIRLLSTVFLDGNNCTVTAPNTLLTTKFIQNIRRSPQMSESFEFDVAYSTTFEQIEQLRAKMLAFVQSERRDYQPSFDVVVKDIPDQEKLVLSADIKYKSNWQQGSVKVKRRNKWVCALKASLAELKIFGPKGNPDAESGPTLFTQIPWEEVQAMKEEEKRKKIAEAVTKPRIQKREYSLTDKSAAAALVEEDADLYNNVSGQTPLMTPGGETPSRPGTSHSMGRPPGMPASPAVIPPIPQRPDEYEMAAASSLSQRRPGDSSNYV